MGFYKVMMLSLNIICLSSCSAALGSHSKDQYEQGFKEGVKKQVDEVGGEFKGGDFPYYHWAAPMVQEVLTPAQISNGVMIPEHKELVIIKPGAWVMNGAYPIQSQQRKTYDNQEARSTNNDVSNLTVLP